MTGFEYRKYLYDQISEKEWHILLEEPGSLIISRHNLLVLRSLWEHVNVTQDKKYTAEKKVQKERSPEKQEEELWQSVDRKKASSLEKLLKEYLNTYMGDQPDGQKWIIIASLYLAIVQRLPMHPIDMLHIRKVEEGDTITYLCPEKDMTKGCICEYCVCKPVV